MAVVWVPSLLQPLTGGAERITVAGATLRQVVNNIGARYPEFKARLVTDDEQFMDGIAIAIDGEVATLGLLERVGENSEIHIIPAIAGGQLAQQDRAAT